MRLLWLLAGIVCLFLFSTCKKEPLLEPSSDDISFSVDTVLFDTVFTTIGSATHRFKIYNNSRSPVMLDHVILPNSQSQFRFNIDGFPGPAVSKIEIPPRDSLFIFVEVTVDPLNSNSPLVVEDSLLFRFGKLEKKVQLVAWGQDVHYINGQIICNETWSNDKPYLIYNSMLVDTQCVLNILPGTRLYFHPNSRMYVLGTLNVQGNAPDPVIMQGDRLEYYYRDIPSQWIGIWLMSGSFGNEINHAIIKNGILGIQVDTNIGVDPTLKLSNSIIKNMSLGALVGQGARIEASNCEFSNSGTYLAALTIGGDYLFNQCTFANYWTESSRSSPSVLISNYYKDLNGNIQVRNLARADFLNCIVYGSQEFEVAVDEKGTGMLNYAFRNSLVKYNGTLTGSQIWYNTDPGFKDSLSNYHLSETSFAIDKGNPAYITPETQMDLEGDLRTGNPDLGAYELKP